MRDCPKEGLQRNAAGGQLSGHCAEQRCPEYRAAQRTAASNPRDRLARRGHRVIPCIYQPAMLLAASTRRTSWRFLIGIPSVYRHRLIPVSRRSASFSSSRTSCRSSCAAGRFPEFPRRSFALPVPVRTLRQTFVSPLRQPRGSTISRPMSCSDLVPNSFAELHLLDLTLQGDGTLIRQLDPTDGDRFPPDRRIGGDGSCRDTADGHPF